MDSDLRVNKPQLTVSFDRDRAEDLGVPVGDVATTLQVLLGGNKTSTFTRANKQYDVIVQLDPRARATPSDMTGLYVRGRGGELVKLEALASVQEGVGPRELNHFNRVRSATLTASLAPGFTLGEALDSLNRFANEVLPKGSSTALAGESRELEESGSSLYFAFLLALVVVFMVLASQFESLVHPFTVLLAVPLAVTGALFTLKLAGSTLNVYSQIGMILLIGLVTKNSILLVEYINQLKERGMTTLDAAQEAGRIRLRPILMTSVATVMGALPIALGLGAGSLSRRPLGYAIVGGLMFSTLLTLYVVPAVYVIFDGLLERSARRRTVRATCSGAGGGRVMLLLLLALQANPVQPDSVPAADSLPRITLAEALRRSTRLDPDYVQALGQIDNAEWGRRAAMLAFFVPADHRSAWTRPSTLRSSSIPPIRPIPTSTLVVGRASANYEIFSLRKFAELSRTKADLASAEAGELEQRFRAALETESSYYDVLVNQELTRVTGNESRRARQGLGVARARVTLGRGGADRLASAGAGADPGAGGRAAAANALRTAQLELGRRVGAGGPGGRRTGRHRCTTAASRSAPTDAVQDRSWTRGRSIGRLGPTRAQPTPPSAPSGATICRFSASAACTSDTTPRSSPARRTLPRSPSACPSRSGTTGSGRSSSVEPGQPGRGARDPGRPRASGAARRHQRVRHLRDRHGRRRAGPCGGDRGPAELSDAGPALPVGSQHDSRPARLPGQPGRGRGRAGPGPICKPGWPWRSSRRFSAADSSRTRTLRESSFI